MAEDNEPQLSDESWLERVVTFKNAVIAFAIIEAIVILLSIYHKFSR